VIVIGGGDSAMEDALVLARTSKKVTMVHRREAFHKASHTMATRVLEHPKISVQWNKQVAEFKGGEASEDSPAMLQSVRLKDTVTGIVSTLSCDAAFVAIGHIPNTQLFEGQLEMDEQGYLAVRPGSTYTTVEGVFAAGDVADKTYRQAITSAGTGAMAALDAERWLSEHGLGVETSSSSAAGGGGGGGGDEEEMISMDAEPVAEPEGVDDLMAELLAEMQQRKEEEEQEDVGDYPSHVGKDDIEPPPAAATAAGGDGDGGQGEDEEVIVTDDSDL
jgi:NADH dehydrogenase FAD-containing subunit